jgi:hypothetical protein
MANRMPHAPVVINQDPAGGATKVLYLSARRQGGNLCEVTLTTKISKGPLYKICGDTHARSRDLTTLQ